LHIVLDWDHEFAEAYHLLALAQMEGGGLHAATDSIRAAIQLSPRKPAYLLDLAKIYEGGKNWDAATALLDRLSSNPNPELASAAKKQLQDLPYIKKYGIPPQGDTTSSSTVKPPTPSTAAVTPASSPVPAAKSTAATTDTKKPSTPPADENDETNVPVPEPQIDKRPIQYGKGKLLSIDCSKSPVAILTVSLGAKTLKLHTTDYKSLMLIGADTFSCDWADRPVSVNYKAGGKSDGDLVSLEVH
jgi:tetratricopeptide (TPR) repeat protein